MPTPDDFRITGIREIRLRDLVPLRPDAAGDSARMGFTAEIILATGFPTGDEDPRITVGSTIAFEGDMSFSRISGLVAERILELLGASRLLDAEQILDAFAQALEPRPPLDLSRFQAEE